MIGEDKVLVGDARGLVRNAVIGDFNAGNFVANGWAGVVV